MSDKAHVEFVSLKKNYINPNSVQAIHANEVTINNIPTEFFITFYRLEPPIILDDEDRKKVTDAGKLDAVAVAKIVMTPTFARAFQKTLAQQIKTFDRINEEARANETGGESNA